MSSSPRVFRPRRATPSNCVRPTRAEVSLGALRHNFGVLSQAARVPVWPVLKADGYGHGSRALGRTLERAGAQGMCVSLLEEGVELREAGIVVPILIMGGTYGSAWAELLDKQLTPVVSRLDQLFELAQEARYQSRGPVNIHVKVDTGMSRLGALEAELLQIAEALEQHPELRLQGLMTHLASADTDPESVAEQLARFERATELLSARGIVVEVRHAANTAATLRHPEARFDLVRPGIGLFGYAPPASSVAEPLQPVMRVQSQVIALRDLPVGAGVGYGGRFLTRRPSRIATVALGYADGLSRALSDRGQLLVLGRRAPIVGAISMDMTSLDVTDVPGVALGDEVVVLGRQHGPLGEDRLTAEDLAQWQGTISFEVLTSVSRSVPRFYRED